MNHDSSVKCKCTFQILSQHVCMTWRKTVELPANGELNLFGTSLQFRSDVVNSLCNKWHPQGALWWMKHRFDHGTSMHRRTLAFSGLGLMHRTKCGSETSILPISCRRETRNLQERMGPRLGIFDASMALFESWKKIVGINMESIQNIQNSTVPYKSKMQAVWHSLSSAYSNHSRMYLNKKTNVSATPQFGVLHIRSPPQPFTVDQTVPTVGAKRGASLTSTWVYVLWLLDLAQPLPWPTASGGLALDWWAL